MEYYDYDDEIVTKENEAKELFTFLKAAGFVTLVLIVGTIIGLSIIF